MKLVYSEQVLRASSDETVMAFFFNARGGPMERSPKGMYRSLLHQLLGSDSLPQLGKGANMSIPTRGLLPLHTAIRRGHDQVVVLLLQGGADVDAKEWKGQTALLLAVERDHLALATALMDKYGATLELKDETKQTPLLLACKLGDIAMVEALLATGTRVDRRDMKGRTALTHAAIGGYERIVGLLLCHGADPTNFDDAGETPYSLASHHMRGIFHQYAYNGRYNLAMLRTEN